MALCLSAMASVPAQTGAPPDGKAMVAAEYGKLPLSFEPNQGQADPAVRFLARGKGYSLYLTDAAAVLALRGGKATDTVRMELAGARPGAHVEGTDRLEGTSNYFVGSDPAKWHRAVPTYGKVRYEGVYRGVDLLYYGNQGQLEYDFVVAPYARTEAIRLRFTGAQDLQLSAAGDLRVLGAHDEVAFHKPVMYQEVEGGRREVLGQYRLMADGSVGFAVGKYNHALPLTIDPVLVYSTFVGGSGTYGDEVGGIAVDAAGSAYITGNTMSADFPVTPGAYDTDPGVGILYYSTVFVSKLNPAGTALVYSTFIGKVDEDSGYAEGNSIAVDGSGNAYVAGSTNSANFPITPGAFQTTPSSLYFPNGFVAKLNSTGTALIYSTYLGHSDHPSGIAVDRGGNAFVAGRVANAQQGGSFPTTPGAYQTTVSSNLTSFIAKLNAAGTGLVYSTYLGGDGANQVNALAIDENGNAYVAGNTSGDFPVTPGAFQSVRPSSKAKDCTTGFVTKMNPSGTALVYSTYLGGSGVVTSFSCYGDVASGIALDSSGYAYVVGAASSLDFPVSQGAFQTQNRAKATLDGNVATNAFVTKLNLDGSGLAYSTYLGGSGAFIATVGDHATAVAVDASGDAFVSGFGSSPDFPVTSDAFLRTFPAIKQGGAITGLVSELNAKGTGLIYSTYLGGSGSNYPDALGSGDLASGIALDRSGNVYVTGTALSPDFPTTPGAFQRILHQGSEETGNPFVTRFNTTGGGSTPAHLLIVSGTHQFATINTAFAEPLVVKVVDKDNQPVSGVMVSFSAAVSGGSCTLSAASGVTGADGTASVRATANGLAGPAGYTPTASLPGTNLGVHFFLVNTKAAATVSLYLLDRIYTGYPLGAFAKTNPAGLTVRFSYDGDTGLAPTEAGTHSVVGTIADSNYEGSASATSVIEKATPRIFLGGLTQVDTGSPRMVTATTSPAGLPVTITYNGSAAPPTAVGKYAVSATVSTSDFSGSASGVLTITAAPTSSKVANK